MDLKKLVIGASLILATAVSGVEASDDSNTFLIGSANSITMEAEFRQSLQTQSVYQSEAVKTCFRCKISLPIDSFSTKGKGRYESNCKVCAKTLKKDSRMKKAKKKVELTLRRKSSNTLDVKSFEWHEVEQLNTKEMLSAFKMLVGDES